MSRRDSHNRKVSFDIREELGDKIDKLAMMIGKLATRDSGAGRQLKPQIYQGRGRGQIEVTMTDAIMISEPIRTKIDKILEIEDSIDRTEVGLDMNKIIGEVISEVTLVILTDRIIERKYRSNYRNGSYDRSRNRSKERSFSRNFSRNRNRSTSNSKSRSGLRASTNRDRIRCYKCREYDHLTKDSSNRCLT